uniref:Metalloendopeptidase n=1 Tax=Electrophorus electricus TaxID=8005 RepID=A0AAY5F0Y2_ELEEL
MFVFKVTVGLLALLLVGSVRAKEEVRETDAKTHAHTKFSQYSGNERRLIFTNMLLCCMWPKSSDGKVHVPYVIANHFCTPRGLVSFSSVACIHFRRRSNERDYISIESCNGCYSFVGRRGYAQTVSLDRNGCIYHHTVQHELLHALGFNHEQTRSDRDNHILVVWENIIDNMKHNFNKIATLNQETPYDYNSVMQYHKTAFSKNGLPTMVPIPNSNVAFGQATQMSQNDITRLNRLYKCSTYGYYRGVCKLNTACKCP